MKFSKDREHKSQFDAYKEIAGDDDKVVVMKENDCECDDRKKNKHLVYAAQRRLADIKDRGYQHAAKVVPVAAGAAGAVVTGGASLSAPAVLGRILGAVGL